MARFSISSLFRSILFLLLVSVFFQCNRSIPSLAPAKTIVGGILDLSEEDPKTLDPFPLAGEWDAFPGELPETEEEFKALDQKEPTRLAIPAYWVNQNLPAHGFVTYRLKLKVKDHINLMFYLRETSSAYRAYYHNVERGLVLLGSAGKVSKTKEGSVGYFLETGRSFRATPSTVIYLQISNYLYSRGGPYYSPVLGEVGKTVLYLRFKERKKAFFFAIFLVLALSHLFLFIHRKKDKSPLWFSLLCISWLVRILLFDRVSRDWFVASDGLEMFQIRLEYIAFCGIQIFSLLFFFQNQTNFFPEKYKKYLMIPILLELLIIMTTPYAVYTKLLIFSQVYMSFILILAMVASFRSCLQRETRYIGSIILFGTLVILSATIYDSVVFFKRWDLPMLTELGFAIFCMCLAIVISKQNAHTWETAEYLTLNLRKEVEWKTLELKKEKEKAEKTGELKDKFISIVSHDIRSPLFGISSVFNLLTESPPSLSPERAKQVLGEASTGLKNILSMVEELIKYSRFQNASVFPDYQLFDFRQITDQLIERVQEMAGPKNISIITRMEESSIGIGDPNLIEHLIWNLLTNAVKFTKESGTVEISLTESNKHWSLKVIDTGIGMPPYWAEHILEEGFLFVRKGTADEMGAGVGIAFCKEVAERHGAELIVRSEEDHGTSVELLLPNFEKIVLVLDDNPGYRKQIRKVLKDLPCILWEEEYPDHALLSVGRLKPDLIIVDYSMPEKTGVDFLRDLYSNSEMEEIRSLLVSSSHTDPNTGYKLETTVIEIGGDAFLTKTSPDEKLVEAVKRLLDLEI
ncbi:hybrid sensor histidine kinase/response regulator [Leptospira harrisiae]|uniref:hybrid sensor histidine kinase/response regulator n=1 Tax=Leptospira harrisiae TaxID=2023189 RepID=UPI000C2AC045|nr:ATP-binding protein [Leptospira harrisiae]PKA07982.1 histidine kinase [Leptospira harrisiae]